jgi:hypothetical protein
MMISTVLVLFILGQVYGEKYGALFDVFKLTDNGDHSFPMFSSDGTKIYFAAKNGQYETKCEHVYQMDIQKPALNQQISLFGSGIGREIRPVKYDDGDSKLISIVGTAFNKPPANAKDNINQFNNDFFCPAIKCTKEDNIDSDIKEACKSPLHNIHNDGEALMHFDLNGEFKGTGESTSNQALSWINQVVKLGEKEVYSRSCEGGECIYLKGDEVSGALNKK